MNHLFNHICLATIAISSSTIIFRHFSSFYKRRKSEQIALERLNMIKEAAEMAEERLLHLQNRHDRLLSEVCSYYLCHREMEAAVIGAREAVVEAMAVVRKLEKMQLWILASYPEFVDLRDALV